MSKNDFGIEMLTTIKLWLMLNLSSNIVTVIKVHRLECLGHVARMDGERTVVKFLQSKPGGQRKKEDLD